MSSASVHGGRSAQPSLEVSELRYRRLFEAAQDGIVILDAETGAITDVNPVLIEMLGYSRRDLLEKRLWEVGAFKDARSGKQAFEALQKNKRIRYEDLPLKAKDGHLVQVEFVSNAYWAGDEEVIQCNIRDITARVKAQAALQVSEARYRRLFETAQDGILILDAATGKIDDVNPFLMEMLGYSRAEFVEKKLWEVGAFKDVEANKFAFQALQKNEYIRYENLPLKAKTGKLMQVEFVSNVYLVGTQKVIQCNIRDITDRKRAEEALAAKEALLREQSVRDHLTGLFNRRYMEETMERELRRASRKQGPVGIMLMDVDGFKGFNDNYGHAAGDAVLRELGTLLLEHVRADDMPCRYGGDEFMIMLPDASLETTIRRARRLCEHCRNLRVEYDGQTLKAISLSLGIAMFPSHGATAAEVLRAADAALYRAKAEGPGVVVVGR